VARVIFAGQSGIRKREAIEAIAAHCRQEHNVSENLSRTQHNAHILPVEFEAHMTAGESRRPVTAFLDSFNNEMRSAIWHDAFGLIHSSIRAATPENVFLAMHLCLYRHSNFFTFTDWRDLRAFHPDMIITLFDDIYDVWARIRARTERMPDRTMVTLKELFAWRSAEAFFAEQLSRNLYEDRTIPHYQVAVKHSLGVFEKLIFKENTARIYASYPISHVRTDPKAVAQINAVRLRLHDEFIVFDPVTIDERILQAEYEAQMVPAANGALPDTISIERSHRWPLSPDNACILEQADSLLYPICIPSSEIESLSAEEGESRRWRDIDDNIRWRDFALINQSQGVLAYRPGYGCKQLSVGVTRELNYAMDTRIIPCVVYWPKEDGPSDNHPFSPNVIFVSSSLDEAIETLKSHLDSKEAS